MDLAQCICCRQIEYFCQISLLAGFFFVSEPMKINHFNEKGVGIGPFDRKTRWVVFVEPTCFPFSRHFFSQF